MPGSSGDELARSASRSRTAARCSSSHSGAKNQSPALSTAASPCAQLGRGEQAARLQLRSGDRRAHDRADDRLRVAALEQLQALRVEAPRRRGVEHHAAADGRLGAQDDAVAAGGDDRLAQPQLGVAALAHDACGHVARPDVDGERGRERLELLERDVEPPADRVGARLDEHVPALELRARDPRQVDRDALPRLGALDLDVVHLDAAGARAQAGGLDAELVARRRSSPTAACP